MSPCTRRLLTLCLVITLGSPVAAAADEPIPEAVLSFTRTLTGTADPNAVRATPVPGLLEVRVQHEQRVAERARVPIEANRAELVPLKVHAVRPRRVVHDTDEHGLAASCGEEWLLLWGQSARPSSV